MKKNTMREKFILFGVTIIISFLIYINMDASYENENDYTQYTKLSKKDFLSDENLLRNFNSGISIKDIGDLVIIEQKPNATVIINKNDLDEIIAFLNNSNSSNK